MRHTISARGVDLAAETFGHRSDPAIVLLHGAGNSMLSWPEEFCERLASGGRLVIRYDTRDHGRSTTYERGRPPYGLSDLVTDVGALLDGLGIERAHTVGLSQGGAVAQLLALDQPERVATLTLISSTPGGPGHEAPDLPGMSPELERFFSDEPPEPDWSDRSATVEYLVAAERPFASPASFDEKTARLLAERVFDRAGDIAASVTNPFLIDPGESWRDRLGEIQAPTLIVHGRDDPMFPSEHAEALAREIPGADLLLLDDTGHEYPPPATWGAVVPAILMHTGRIAA